METKELTVKLMTLCTDVHEALVNDPVLHDEGVVMGPTGITFVPVDAGTFVGKMALREAVSASETVVYEVVVTARVVKS